MRTSTLASYLSTVDHGDLIYDRYSAIDLKNLAELGPLWSVGVFYAKVTSLPAGYDWSPVRAVGFRWHECWVPVLRQPQINDIWIFNATQDALSTLDRKLTNKDAPGVLELVSPRISAGDSWFKPYFEADRVGIVRCPEVDFAGAGAFGRIERLEFSEVSRVRNLAHFSGQGELNLLVLDNIEILDPETFWDIQAQRIVVRGYGKNLRWLYKIWPDRPDDWADRVRLGERLAADLDPEGRSGNLFEGYYEPVVEGDFSAQEADIEATALAREEITEQRFWHIIGRARESCDGDAEGLAEALRKELRQSTQPEIVAFDRLFVLKTNALYSWELWGVAYLLLGGCGDDEFTDVRTWVVAQGRDFYHSCLADPTLLGNGQLNDPAVVMDAEEIRYVPEEIFMEMTGTSIEEQYRDQPSASMAGQAPAGIPWDEYVGGLEARFPRIRALEGLWLQLTALGGQLIHRSDSGSRVPQSNANRTCGFRIGRYAPSSSQGINALERQCCCSFLAGGPAARAPVRCVGILDDPEPRRFDPRTAIEDCRTENGLGRGADDQFGPLAAKSPIRLRPLLRRKHIGIAAATAIGDIQSRRS